VKDAPIITSRKIISGTEIKNHSSRAIRVSPTPELIRANTRMVKRELIKNAF